MLGIRIRLVDGTLIRNSIDINFAGWGSQADYLYVPSDEFWVERKLEFEAQRLLTIATFYENTPAASGDALRQLVKEKFAHGGLPIHPRMMPGYPPPVRFVNGYEVRLKLDPLFVMGGHPLVYDYIPKGQIWIDDTSPADEYRYTIAHELHEYELMKKGESYHNAHDFSLALEKKRRRADGVKFFEDAYSPLSLWQLIKTFYIN